MKPEAELLLFGQQWDRAMEANDAAIIGEFMSDDWVIVGTEGGITSKADFLEAISSGDLTHNRMDSDETRIKVYDNTAVVTSRGTSAGEYKGQPFHLYEWSTSMFIKQGEKWSCVLTMLTPAINGSADIGDAPTNIQSNTKFKSGYSNVNGLKMYYEIYGQGKPLVLLHGGGSTIQTTFGRVIPQLARNRQIIGVELQAHGRTNDRDTPLSFEQDADDVAALLNDLKIPKADFMGFSNGGTTALQIAIRHPQLVDKLVLASALTRRGGAPSQFWDFMKQASLDNMPQQLKDAYGEVAPTGNLQVMHDKCAQRMVEFNDISDELIRSVKAPTLIVIGDADVMSPEHAVEMHRLIPGSQLAIIPGGHGKYIGEIMTIGSSWKESDFIVPMIEEFLDKT
ncbi:alpha/beta fold hydrolase [Flavihumibacter sp. R14]|nr:alpha/beta fold hydrolase [Flavihumibacter soli]